MTDNHISGAVPAMLPRAAIFDWDNTLIDTFPLLMEASNLVREKLGYPLWSDAEARANIRLAGKDSFPRLYGSRAAEAEGIFYGHIHANHLKAVRLMPGAAELLAFLSQHAVPMGVLSNKRGHILRREVGHIGWAGYFKAVHGPDDVGHVGKPNPAGLLATMERMGLLPLNGQGVWYLGDTENDIRTAQAAGVESVFIENNAMSDPREIAALSPKLFFTNCIHCLDYLKGLVDSQANIFKTKE